MRKEDHSSNRTITSSFSFVTLVRNRAIGLHLKKTKIKNILTNCSHISLISSRIQATSKEQILSELMKSTSSAKLLSTMTLEKQVFWQNKRALRMTAAAVQRGWSSFLIRSQDVAKTSPSEFRIRKPTPTEDLDRDCEKARFNLKTESAGGGDYFLSGALGIAEPILLTSMNSVPSHTPKLETTDHLTKEFCFQRWVCSDSSLSSKTPHTNFKFRRKQLVDANSITMKTILYAALLISTTLFHISHVSTRKSIFLEQLKQMNSEAKVKINFSRCREPEVTITCDIRTPLNLLSFLISKGKFY